MAPETSALSARNVGVICLIIAFCSWGFSWPINKVLLQSISPFWLAAYRSLLATAIWFVVAAIGRQLIIPPRSDFPVIASIALLHMTGFSLLAAIGLQHVPVGRSVVVAYTTPLWVAPGAALFLGEKLTPRKVIGIGLGLMGLAVLFNPLAFDWRDPELVFGHIMLLIAPMLWAGSILHIRGHKWTSTPFQLVPWESLLATTMLFSIAFITAPYVEIDWNVRLVGLLCLSCMMGTVLAYWAIATAGRRLSAVTVSLGLLGTPIVGTVTGTLALGEPLDLSVWTAIVLVSSGVALGATATQRKAATAPKPA